MSTNLSDEKMNEGAVRNLGAHFQVLTDAL